MSDTIGDKIKKRRLALGLSQAELARRAGYADKSGISKIESGERSLTPEKIELFARALNMSPTDLLPSVWDVPLHDAPLILTAEEEDIIRKLRALPDAERERMIEFTELAFSVFMRRAEEGK